MAIPPKDEAVEIAEMNVEQDAAKYIRRIESLLMLWDGKSEIKIDIPKDDFSIGEYLLTLLKVEGYEAKLAKKPGSSPDYSLFFK